jgi:hypothetical protein
MPVSELEELKRCPFCNAAAKLHSFGDAGQAGSQSWSTVVRCTICQAQGPVFRDGAFQPEGQHLKAIEGWNNAPRNYFANMTDAWLNKPKEPL